MAVSVLALLIDLATSYPKPAGIGSGFASGIADGSQEACSKQWWFGLYSTSILLTFL